MYEASQLCQEETLKQFATTSHAEAMREQYGPYAELFAQGGPMDLSLRALEEELGIKDLKIRLWPATGSLRLKASYTSRLRSHTLVA